MSVIHFVCPSCTKNLRIPSIEAGALVRCPSCGKSVRVTVQKHHDDSETRTASFPVPGERHGAIVWAREILVGIIVAIIGSGTGGIVSGGPFFLYCHRYPSASIASILLGVLAVGFCIVAGAIVALVLWAMRAKAKDVRDRRWVVTAGLIVTSSLLVIISWAYWNYWSQEDREQRQGPSHIHLGSG